MRKNCRTIVMAYVNLQSGRIEFLAKSLSTNKPKRSDLRRKSIRLSVKIIDNSMIADFFRFRN